MQRMFIGLPHARVLCHSFSDITALPLCSHSSRSLQMVRQRRAPLQRSKKLMQSALRGHLVR
jgi:hypothetical protein